jgi:hypothetical protein
VSRLGAGIPRPGEPLNAPPWLRIALARSTVIRAAKTGVVVGALLIAINYGGALLHQRPGAGQWIRMGLTVLVPYLVSTVSTVQASLDGGADPARRGPPSPAG